MNDMIDMIIDIPNMVFKQQYLNALKYEFRTRGDAIENTTINDRNRSQGLNMLGGSNISRVKLIYRIKDRNNLFIFTTSTKHNIRITDNITIDVVIEDKCVMAPIV